MQRKSSGGGGGGSGMCDLPMDCIACIASLTSPGDACRLAAAAAALRPVADSDDVWGSFLPPEWAGDGDGDGDALDGKPGGREGESKEMFLRLCDSPVLLDGGKLVIKSLFNSLSALFVNSFFFFTFGSIIIEVLNTVWSNIYNFDYQ